VTSLVSVVEARDLIQTGLSDSRLQTIIDREEAEIIRRFGSHYDGATSIVETVRGEGKNIYLRRTIASVVSVSEVYYLGALPVSLAATQYFVWPNEGRLERLPSAVTGIPAWSGSGVQWGEQVTVTYLPQDDSARREQAIIELIRLALEQTAMKSESVGGEYTYQAPDWEQTRARIYRRVGFYMNM
jgi:hypothetical protein